MQTTALKTIELEVLITVVGGDSGGFGEDLKNLGKAAVNGGVNTLNFFHDHPINLGKFGTFSVGGDRIQKPFTNNPLSKVGQRTVSGTPHPARR